MPNLTMSLLALACALAGCAGGPREAPNQQAGAVVGAVVGGVLGHQIGHGSGRAAATIVGAIAGGAIGSQIGRSMDDMDRLRAAHALETQPTGAAGQWTNPDTGHAYRVVPTRTFGTPHGPCREYTMDATIDGRQQRVYGTACRQPDGSWQGRN